MYFSRNVDLPQLVSNPLLSCLNALFVFKILGLLFFIEQLSGELTRGSSWCSSRQHIKAFHKTYAMLIFVLVCGTAFYHLCQVDVAFYSGQVAD